jgi:transcriptional regulator with XRE-family HTH domain
MIRRASPLSKSPFSPERAALRDLLAETREASGIRQDKLAERLGRHQSFIAKYEAGERRIEVTEFIAIARAMNADPVALLRKLLKRIG